jgi:signal transduction histidine kinase
VDAVVVLVGLSLPSPFASIALVIAVAVTTGAIVAAITQHRLYDVDPLLSSTLAYGGLAVAVVLLDLAVVAVAGSVLNERESALVALTAVTLVYAPLRARGWDWARRLLRGERDDPYAVLATVASALERSDDTDDQLATVVRTLRSAFRSPYARCEVLQPGGERLVVEDGEPGPDTVTLPITYRGETVGRLELVPSRAARLDDRDQVLLGDVLRQAAAATRATHLAQELQASRQAIVVTREEERRRLRRDLHDGLGPSLAAVRLRIQTARNLAPSDPARADAVLSDASDDVAAVVQDIRRLVHGLRPPALDERGLGGAVTQLVGRLTSDAGITIDVDHDSDLDVAAAVEVAAYRVVSESLANVVRHAQATRGWVHLTAVDGGETLLVEVSDDGVGVPTDAPAGVGLASLRERAAELGGRVVVDTRPGGGTRVRAWLPWRLADSEEVTADATG